MFKKTATFSTLGFGLLRFGGGIFRAGITATALSYDSSSGFYLAMALVHGLISLGVSKTKNSVCVSPRDLD
jgi:hypothetical protein